MPEKQMGRRDGTLSISYSMLVSFYICIYDTIETSTVIPGLWQCYAPLGVVPTGGAPRKKVETANYKTIIETTHKIVS